MSEVFSTLSAINVNDKTEQKNGLTYLSWAWAWGETKKKFPDATYTIYENKDGLLYHTDGKTCWVKTGVTIQGLEHIEYLPVMDYRNQSISLEKVTSVDANKAVQRSLTKAIARHGLGLYIYAGEDIPDSEQKTDKKSEQKADKKDFTPTDQKSVDDFNKIINSPYICQECKKEITAFGSSTPKKIAEHTKAKYGVMLCDKCATEKAEAAYAQQTD